MPEPVRADLHLHTTASDGAWPPEAMVRVAREAGMTLIAITDHDTVAGVARAKAEGAAQGITVLAGIELSCGRGEEVHVLGYGMEPDDARLAAFLEGQMAGRRERTLAMLDRLSAMGMPVDPAEFGETAFMGRVNLAYAMVARGYVHSAAEAFDRYLNPGKPAFVPRVRVDVSEGIAMLAQAGPVVSIAHPGRLRMEERTFSALLPEWIEAGLSGLEAYHPSHSAQTAERLSRLAGRRGLLVTGGSDCHGRADGAKIGDHLGPWREINEDIRAFSQRLTEWTQVR